jgi:hypothetical protein
MYTIDIILRGNPVALSVQRKEQTAAVALYKEILAALSGGQARPLELTCEKMTEKRMAVMTSDVVAVQIVPARGSSAMLGGGKPGFFGSFDDNDDE